MPAMVSATRQLNVILSGIILPIQKRKLPEQIAGRKQPDLFPLKPRLGNLRFRSRVRLRHTGQLHHKDTETQSGISPCLRALVVQ
jgi:hypothetical protein